MKKSQPNILLLIPDGMQAAVTFADSECRTPHFDRLAAQGTRCRRAYTVNPTCSPARSSLMTGVLPHNHGVLQVEHATDPDQGILRLNYPHWAEKLQSAGYRTGYFGKWHIEPENKLEAFGWSVNGCSEKAAFRNIGVGEESKESLLDENSFARYQVQPAGYNPVLHYGVTDRPSDSRDFVRTTDSATQFIEEAQQAGGPWACCVSFAEPNVPVVAGREMYDTYDPEGLSLPENFRDPLKKSPGLYRREQSVLEGMSEQEWRELRAVYFALVSEIDAQFGRLLDLVEEDLEKTIVLVMSDHGRYVGGHRFDHHNVGAFEEIYRIPLIVAGPGIARGEETQAVVSLLDLYPTLLEWCSIDTEPDLEGRSLVDLFRNPSGEIGKHRTAFAENHGTRFTLTQRVFWEGDWKFVFNGFDFDELYNLAEDPHELDNLAGKPEYHDRIEYMMRGVWDWIRRTDDRALLGTHYSPMRIGAVGPNEE